MNNNEITKLEGKLENIKDICERNNKIAKENEKEIKEMLNNHCRRIRSSENDLIEIRTEVKPLVNLYNRFAQFLIGFCIIVGGLFIGALIFLKDKIK